MLQIKVTRGEPKVKETEALIPPPEPGNTDSSSTPGADPKPDGANVDDPELVSGKSGVGPAPSDGAMSPAGIRALKWAVPNSLTAVALFAAYAWICSYWYLSGFYGPFGVELDQIGFDRAAVTSRTLTIGIVVAAVYLPLATAFLCIALGLALAVFIGLLITVSKIFKVRRLGERLEKVWHWLSNAWEQSRFTMFVTAAILGLFAMILTVLRLHAAGQDDAAHVLKSTTLEYKRSFVGELFGARAQPVRLQWLPTTMPSPLTDRTGKPQDSAHGFLLGESNGVTVFVSSDGCRMYHLPTSSVSVVVRVRSSPTDGSNLSRGSC